MMQEIVVAPFRERRTFQTDDSGDLFLVVGRHLKRDRAAHGATHHNGIFDTQRQPEVVDQVCVDLCRQLIFFQPPVVGRVGPAVPRHVEGDHAALRRDIRIVEDMPELTAVRAGGVQADQWHALTGLFVEDAVLAAETFDIDVTADDRFQGGIRLRHRPAPSF